MTELAPNSDRSQDAGDHGRPGSSEGASQGAPRPRMTREAREQIAREAAQQAVREESPEARQARIARLRDQIKSGEYLTAQKLELALDQMIAEHK